MKKLSGVLLCASVLGAPAAMAGVTGNAGAFSTYMFRGVDQSLGAAAQGGADYAHGSGLYAGTWISTTDPSVAGSGYEADLYGGFTASGFDAGYIFYGYRDTAVNNFSEFYLGWSGFGVSAKVYYSPEFGATEDPATYGTLSYALALNDTLALTPQVGFSSGDGVKMAFGDTYTDYSLTLTKSLQDGFAFSLGYVANTLESDPAAPDFSVYSEKGQAVVGLKKTFDL